MYHQHHDAETAAAAVQVRLDERTVAAIEDWRRTRPKEGITKKLTADDTFRRPFYELVFEKVPSEGASS
jgi:hypothetical protein